MRTLSSLMTIILTVLFSLKSGATVSCQLVHVVELNSKSVSYMEDYFDRLLNTPENQNEFQAWWSYFGAGYKEINRYLRAENPDFSNMLVLPYWQQGIAAKEEPKKWRRAKAMWEASLLDQVFKIGPVLDSNVVLYRGAVLPLHLIPAKGDTMIDSAYLSATFKPDTAKTFIKMNQQWSGPEDRKVLIQIHNQSKRRVMPGRANEQEVIFDRHTKLKIEEVTDDGELIVIRATVVD